MASATAARTFIEGDGLRLKVAGLQHEVLAASRWEECSIREKICFATPWARSAGTVHILFSSSYCSPTTIAPQATAPPVPQRAYGKEDVGLAESTDINAVMALSQAWVLFLDCTKCKSAGSTRRRRISSMVSASESLAGLWLARMRHLASSEDRNDGNG